MSFGDYDQVDEKTKNDMTQRTVGAICLGTTHNLQVGYKFYGLKTEIFRASSIYTMSDDTGRDWQGPTIMQKTKGKIGFGFQKQKY